MFQKVVDKAALNIALILGMLWGGGIASLFGYRWMIAVAVLETIYFGYNIRRDHLRLTQAEALRNFLHNDFISRAAEQHASKKSV